MWRKKEQICGGRRTDMWRKRKPERMIKENR
jgi:hypothetical protein